jgi:hypothetical protein
VLKDIRQVTQPIPCRGSQGIFDAPPEVAAQLKLLTNGQEAMPV